MQVCVLCLNITVYMSSALSCHVVVSPDFDLVFHRASTTDYVLLRTMPTLHALSVCLWLRTNDFTNYGTILSYAAESNWLTASDVNVFTLYDYGRLRVSGQLLQARSHEQLVVRLVGQHSAARPIGRTVSYCFHETTRSLGCAILCRPII